MSYNVAQHELRQPVLSRSTARLSPRRREVRLKKLLGGESMRVAVMYENISTSWEKSRSLHRPTIGWLVSCQMQADTPSKTGPHRSSS